MTIVELDLGAFLTHCMPVMLHDGDFTYNVPSNVDDVDLFDATANLPASKPLKETTDYVFQAALDESLALQLQSISRFTSRLRNIQQHLDALETYI